MSNWYVEIYYIYIINRKTIWVTAAKLFRSYVILDLRFLAFYPPAY